MSVRHFSVLLARPENAPREPSDSMSVSIRITHTFETNVPSPSVEGELRWVVRDDGRGGEVVVIMLAVLDRARSRTAVLRLRKDITIRKMQ